MSMPAFARRVIDLEKKMEIVEAWRYMRIGGVVDVTRAGSAAGKLHVGRRLPCAF